MTDDDWYRLTFSFLFVVGAASAIFFNYIPGLAVQILGGLGLIAFKLKRIEENQKGDDKNEVSEI